MKIFNVFAHVFAIFAFLTVGSLLMIVAFHMLSVEQAVFKIREIYSNPWQSIQTGFVGFFFIAVGLGFTRMLVKKGRDSDVVILQSDMGPIFLSVNAIEDVAKKVLKRFHLIKEWKIRTLIRGKDVKMKLRLVLWSNGRIQELLEEIQIEVTAKIRKLLRNESKLEVVCDLHKIEDHEADMEPAIPENRTEFKTKFS